MRGVYFYHGFIRKILLLFGDMFNEIQVVRDGPTSKVNLRTVPIAYAPRQKFLARLEERSDLTADRVQITLPRMSYEISGALIYDAERQTPANASCYKSTTAGGVVRVIAPAPYSLPIQLSIYGKNQDEALQIVEQILPYFKPSITRVFRPIAGEDWTSQATFLLTSVTLNDNYDGAFTDQREVVYTLAFDVKFELYGFIGNGSGSDGGLPLIKSAIVNFKDGVEDAITVQQDVNPPSAGPDDEHTIDLSITYGFE